MSTDQSRPLKRKLSRERDDDETRLLPKQQKFDDDDQLERNLKLIKAVQKRDESNVKKLLKNGNINIDFQDANRGSFSALHFAVKNENVEIIKLLINNGSNPNIQNANGKTPKDLTDNEEILQLLSGDILICEDDEKDVGEVKKDDSWHKALPLSNTKGGNMKSFLHGITYQQKMLLLTLLTGKKHSHDFCMSTEMGDAEKFDDIVYIRYDKNHVEANGEKKKIKFHFFQAKHSQEDDDTSVVETKQKNDICYKDLLSKNPKSNYGLLKYFKSFRLINKRFSPFTVKDFVICTNIGLSDELQDSHNIKIVPKKEKFFTDRFNRFMIQPDPSSELYKTLEEASDMWILASTLIDHFQNNKPLKLNEFIFSLYHILLFKYGILMHSDSNPYTKNAEDEPKHVAIFNPEFLKNKVNNENAKTFYEVCLHVLGNDKEKLLAFENKKLERSKPFGQFHERYFNDFTKNECDAFSKELSLMIRESNGNMVLQYHRSKYGKSNETKGFIEKLAYHVLFYGSDKETNQFGKSFFDNKSPQMLYDSIKKELKQEDFDNLKDYKFKISDYHTCYENMKPLTSFEEDKGNLPSEISEFFKSLVFLKTPSDEVLIDTIGKVFQNIHNLSDVSFPRCYMNDVIITWMNKKAGGYLNNSALNNIINEIKGKIKVLEFVGANSKYSVMLKNHVISFEDDNSENTKAEVQRFLKSSDRALFLKTNYYIFGAIKTRNAIIEMEKYKNSDTFIISDAKYLLDKIVKENLKLVLQSKLNLLVIVCEDEEDYQKFDFNNILENSKTQLIVVFSNENENIVNCIIDKTEFQQLTTDSQQKLLNKTITFQGNENIAMKELIENNVEIIDSETLTFLAQQKKTNLLNIGQPVATFPGYNEKFYFPRSMERCDSFDKEVLKKSSKTDLFVIETEEETLKNFVNEELVKDCKENIIINDNEKAEETTHPNKHYFTFIQNTLIWKSSQGSIHLLCEHERENSLFGDEKLSVEKLFNEKTMIISDVAGMGKSTILTSMTKAIKIGNPNIWVFRVYLNRISKIFKKNCSMNKFFEELLLSKLSIEKKIFEHYLKDGRNKILFIMDGYDEVDQNLLDNIDEILKELQTRTMLCITTRVHHQSRLEKLFNTFSYSLTKIENPKEFLIRFWTCFEAPISESNDLEKCAENIIKKFCSSVSMCQKRIYYFDKPSELMFVDYSFVNIPLHLTMLAEIFDDKDQILKTSSGANDVSSDLNLYWLYEKFVYKKHDVYCRYKKKELFDVFNHHEILAVKRLLSEKSVNRPFSNGEIYEAENDARLKDIGIIKSNAEFLHLTYADFFAAKHLTQKLKSNFKLAAECMDEILEQRSIVFQNFLTQRLKIEDRIALLNYAAENSLFNVLQAFISDYYCYSDNSDSGKTPLHYAAASGNIKTVIFVLCHAAAIFIPESFYNWERNSSKTPLLLNLLKYIEVCDKKGKMAYDYVNNSEISEFLGFFEKICRKKYDISLFEHVTKFQWNGKYTKPDDILLQSAHTKLLSKFLIDESENFIKMFLENIHNKQIRKCVFCTSGKQTLLYKILNKKNKISTYVQIKLINFLLQENGIFHKNDEMDSENDSPLTIVIKNCITVSNYEIFKHYLKHENHENYIIHYRYACKKRSYEVVQYLLHDHREILLESGYPLINSALGNCFDTYFILSTFDGYVGDVNIESEEARISLTPLINAIIKHYNIDIIKFLCEKGADVNKAATSGDTPLANAVLRGHSEIIKYLLIDKRAERKTNDDEILFNYFLNPKTLNLDNTGAPLLHQAIRSNNLTLTNVLLQNGANVNEKDEKGVLPFDLAVKHYELVRLLLSYGAIFDAKDYSNEEADSKAISLIKEIQDLFKNPEHLKINYNPYYFVPSVFPRNPHEISCLINAKNQKGQTLLHVTVENKNMDALTKVMDNILCLNRLQHYQFYQNCRERTLNEKDNYGNCPLHIAVNNNDTLTVIVLLSYGANFEKLNGEYMQPVELANDLEIKEILNFLTHLFCDKRYNQKCSAKHEMWIKNGSTLFNSKDSKGNAILHYVNGVELIVQLSKHEYVDFNVLNFKNQKPLEVAIENEDFRKVRYLLNAGAKYTSKHHYLLNKLNPFMANEFKKKIYYELHANRNPDLISDFFRKVDWM